MLKAAGIVLLVLLLVLVAMNFLIVSNVGDRLRALQADLEQLKARQAPASGPAAAAGPVSFDVETSGAFAGDGGEAQSVTLSDRPVREATVALVETIDNAGTRLPVAANAVPLVPGVAGQIPLGRESGCVAATGSGAWSLSLDGGVLRIASRGCAYARPLRGRLRGTLWH
jgi:hypothetical protein